MLKILAGDTDNAIGNRKRNCSGDKISKMTKSKSISSRLVFLTLEARLAFNQLRQTFIKALILQYFDVECYIWIETNAFGYTISSVLNQLIAEMGQWNSVAFFLKKMIPVGDI